MHDPTCYRVMTSQVVHVPGWDTVNRKGTYNWRFVNHNKKIIYPTPLQRDKIEYHLFDMKLLVVLWKSNAMLKNQHQTMDWSFTSASGCLTLDEKDPVLLGPCISFLSRFLYPCSATAFMGLFCKHHICHTQRLDELQWKIMSLVMTSL